MKQLLLALFLLLSTTPVTAAEVAAITPPAAAALVASGKAVLVDVREPAEWAETGVAGPALLLAKSDFDGAQKDWKPFLEKAGAAGGKTIILYCRSGKRASVIGAALTERGHTVVNLGGFKAWEAAGLPIRLVAAPAEKK